MATKKSGSTSPRKSSEIMLAIAEETGLTKKKVSEVIAALGGLIKKDLSKIGTFALSGLFRAVVVRRPATKARKGINPFTKQEVMFAAKPARKVVKIRPAKALKESI